MSSFVAVCVTFVGLALIMVNVAIFLQMILSFPAMLSSNSHAYVQQQRKLHHIPSPAEDPVGSGYPATPHIEDGEAEDEQAWEPVDTPASWTHEAGLQASAHSSPACEAPSRSPVALRRSDSMTRGRPLRRQRRRYTARTVLRV